MHIQTYTDSLIVPECVYRPGSFTGLMTIYESNFLKLKSLAPGFGAANRVLVSSCARDFDLHLTLLKRERYTTTLKLTYWFDEPDGARAPDPDLTLCVYHDARLVEALAGREQHRHHKLKDFDRPHDSELGRRWRINMMLNKWLDYLLDVGHNLHA
jgi:uncharacterized protein YqiB (DUF1249 family)